MDKDRVTAPFASLINLFVAHVLGRPVQTAPDPDSGVILQLAGQQGIWFMIRTELERRQLLPPGQPDQVRYLAGLAGQLRRRHALNRVYDALEARQITYCVLKGDSVSHLYRCPSLRISGDTDLYVPKADFAAALAVLQELDCQVVHPGSHSHHVLADQEQFGRIEVHSRFYDPYLTRLWQIEDELPREAIRRVPDSEGRLIPTLGVTDTVLFLALHWIKHFINGGCGIRALMDLFLHIRRHRGAIDWERFDRIIRQLGFRRLFGHMTGLAICWLRFDPSELPAADYDAAVVGRLLADIERGGLFGRNEPGRHLLGRQYKKQLRQARETGIRAVLRRSAAEPLGKLAGMLFLSRCALAKKYPVLLNRPYLYPLAFGHRLLHLLLQLVRGQRRITQYLFQEKDPVYAVAWQERLALARRLDLL